MADSDTTSGTTRSFGIAARSILGGLGLGILIGAILTRHYEAMLSGSIMVSTSITLITWKEQTP